MCKRNERNKIKSQFKKLRLFIVALLFIGVIQLVIPLITSANTPTKYITVIVEDGDSLWTIASNYKDEQTDIRKYINMIQQHNQKHDTLLQPGEVLEIPIF